MVASAWLQAASSQWEVASVAWFGARADMAVKHIHLTAWHNAGSSDQIAARQHLKIILGNNYFTDYLSQFSNNQQILWGKGAFLRF